MLLKIVAAISNALRTELNVSQNQESLFRDKTKDLLEMDHFPLVTQITKWYRSQLLLNL